MQLKGNVTINAPRAQVWAFLTDPHAVSQCAPGLQSLDIIVPDEKFRAVAAVSLGSMKVKFTANVEWTELNEPEQAVMKVHAVTPGSAVDATSAMKLTDTAAGGTELHWTADVTIHGAIASLAARLMGPVTRKMTGAFFDCVKNKIETA
jgi:uncharacterized protein